MKNVVKISLKIVGYIVFSILILLLFYNSYIIFQKIVLKNDYPDLFGYSNAVIVSGSMEPTLNIGDMIIVKKQDNYEIGDIISFKDDIGVVTHRVYEVTENGYITWGDNRQTNNTPDSEISKQDVYGKVVFTIGKIGTLILFFKTPTGIICLTLIIVLGFILINLLNKVFHKNSNKLDKEI